MEHGADRSCEDKGLVTVQDGPGLPSKYDETDQERFESSGKKGTKQRRREMETVLTFAGTLWSGYVFMSSPANRLGDTHHLFFLLT